VEAVVDAIDQALEQALIGRVDPSSGDARLDQWITRSRS
jgi:hypothetical protein